MDYQYQIKSLFINNVEDYVDADYIAKVFYYNDIATLSRITLIPSYEKYDEYGIKRCFKAYIEVIEWHNSPMAYNMLECLNDPTREPRLIHDIDQWWTVKKNNKPHMCYDSKNKDLTFISILNNESNSLLNMQPIYYMPMTYYYTSPIPVLPMITSMPMLPPIITY
jgi:hypothetical protein